VVALLMGQPGLQSNGTFELTVGPEVSDGRLPARQGHIKPSAGGLSVMALVALLSGTVRLGATSDLNALANIQGQDPIVSNPTVFPILPAGGGPGVELSFNLFAIVSKDTVKYPAVNFNILREPAFALLLGAFESVQLERASFTIQVSTGATNSVYAAVCGPNFALATLEDWLGAPINTIVHGSDQGYVDSVLILPPVHPFEKELRAVSPSGNPIPTFRFSFAGNAGATGTIKGSFTVRARGQYTLGHVRIGNPSGSGKAQIARVVATLPPVVPGRTCAPEDEEDDDEGEDDSDEEEPAATTSPRAAAGAPRVVTAAAGRS